MNLLVCVDKNYGIGYNNRLLFSIPDDMKFFKEKTIGKIVVMGKNTFLSLPFQKPLANRTNIILSTEFETKDTNCIVCNNIPELFKQLENYDTNDVFIIGGEQIYKQLINYCHKAFVTKVSTTCHKSDSFFSNIDKMDNWKLVSTSNNIFSGDYEITFNEYKNNNVLPKEVSYEL